MFVLRIGEFLALIVIFVLIATQVVMPLFFNQPIFWTFRRKSNKKEVEKLIGVIEDEKTLNDIATLNAEIDVLRKKRDALKVNMDKTNDEPKTTNTVVGDKAPVDKEDKDVK